jgi:GAF domain-containing protein
MVLEPSMIRQIYREEFEQSGVDDVRKYATASIYSGDKLLEALEWLNNKDHGGLAKDQIAIARDAADAAWVSAGASQSANKRATIALVISGFSVLVAIAAIILPYLTKPYG